MTTKKLADLPLCMRVGRKVVNVIAGNIFNSGRVIMVTCDGDQVGDVKFHSKRNKAFFDDAMCADEIHLNVYNSHGTTFLGQIFLVWGNDGWDVVCDYHTSMERYMPTSEQMDKFEAMT